MEEVGTFLPVLKKYLEPPNPRYAPRQKEGSLAVSAPTVRAFLARDMQVPSTPPLLKGYDLPVVGGPKERRAERSLTPLSSLNSVIAAMTRDIPLL